MNVKIKKLHKDAIIPKYQTNGSMGFDICSNVNKLVYSGFQSIINTGLSIQVPEGYGLSIRQRSGLSIKYPNYITIGVGSIDSDYRGEILIPILNRSNFNWDIKHGDRIAQGIIHPIVQANFIEVDELDKTTRGENGFGSTGK